MRKGKAETGTVAGEGQPCLKHVLVTGGAGYVGSTLVPRLLRTSRRVTVLDLYLYGEDVFSGFRGPRLRELRGDVRDAEAVRRALEGVDAVIHLACISNDPSYDLDPELGKSINFGAFEPLVRASKAAGVRRFVYASSSSVYGVKAERDVTEELSLEPLTDYSKYKALCEDILRKYADHGMTTVIVRPATVCGYAPRLRLDLTVNILTNHAVNRGKITVFGGEQLRPNVHIEDMVDFYVDLLEQPDTAIDGQTFNAGWHNYSVMEIARTVRDTLGARIQIDVTPSDDDRSYHISSEKARRLLGFAPQRGIADAVRDLQQAFGSGEVPDPLEDPRYFNLRRMQQVELR